jgi:hypothetical protein
MSAIGSLDEVKLGDILRLFSTSRKSGVLSVAAGSQAAQLHLHKGLLVHASAGRLRGDEAVVDLFGWKQGEITWSGEETPVVPNVVRSLDALILDGLRQGDLQHRIRELIPSDRTVFQLAPGPADESAPLTIPVAAWRLLRLIDGLRDVREVVEASKAPRGDVLRLICELHEACLLERIELSRPMRVQAQGLLAKAVAEVDERWLGEWKRALRFEHGVQRIEVRTLAGKLVQLPVGFRAGLIRDVHLSRGSLAELGARDGDEVFVRPVG